VIMVVNLKVKLNQSLPRHNEFDDFSIECAPEIEWVSDTHDMASS